MTTTLVVLAATMGNKYGGLKYLEGIGPNGETILDYSIYDAVKVGFNKVVFVISKYFEKEFKQKVSSKYENIVTVEYVYQEVENVAEELRHPRRTLLWGSAHAVLCAKGAIEAPFGVINAVNFYQRESFELLYNSLQTLSNAPYQCCLIGYKLGNVMPESGGANRGICEVDEEGYLQSVIDCPQVERIGGHPMYLNEFNKWVNLNEDDCVSMNMWGFTPQIFTQLTEGFDNFIAKNGQDIKAVFIIPDFISDIISQGMKVKNIPTSSMWMALVSPDDKIQAILRINDMIRKKIYPPKIF